MKLFCPECGEELVYRGYRPLFGYCQNCGTEVHVDGSDHQE